MSDFGTDKLVERLNDLEIHIELLHAQAVSTRMKETFLVNFLEQRGIIQEGEFAAYVKRSRRIALRTVWRASQRIWFTRAMSLENPTLWGFHVKLTDTSSYIAKTEITLP